ncbi:MAG: DUF2284 domain-containing protein [Eubacteriales bacterium]
MNREILEGALAELPLLQYEFINPKDLVFSERIRHVCQQECPMYGKTWACPPAVGAVVDCQKKCQSFDCGLVITTVAEVNDIANMEETLATRGDHEDITRSVRDTLLQLGTAPYVLSTEACAICETCAYPDKPCRFPDKMFPCVESHGIVVTDLAERYGIEFLMGNMVVWFSLFLFD